MENKKQVYIAMILVEFVLFITGSQVANSQTQTSSDDIWKCTNGQIIYEGPYELFGINGRAKYQYREGPNRSRIFDGHFVFKYRADGHNIAEGNFSNNHQIGQWIFKGGYLKTFNVYFDEKTRTITGDFSDEKKMQSDEIWDVSGTISGKGSITQFSYSNSFDGFHANGEYNKGKEKGVWYYKEKRKDPVMKIVYDDNGKVLESYYIDQSTGDKISWSFDDARRRANAMKSKYGGFLDSYYMRSTKEFYK